MCVRARSPFSPIFFIGQERDIRLTAVHGGHEYGRYGGQEQERHRIGREQQVIRQGAHRVTDHERELRTTSVDQLKRNKAHGQRYEAWYEKRSTRSWNETKS